MARQLDTEETEVDLTPMIDVCFLLIAFFIMVTEVSKSEVVEIFLPQASNSVVDEKPPDGRIIVNIDRKGKVYVKTKKYGRLNVDKNRDQMLIDMAAFSKAEGFDEEGFSNLVVYVRGDAHVAYRWIQTVMLTLSDEKVKVRKVHYVAKNPQS